MPNVPDSSLKGNAGVWLVGKWLADGGCLVRPVAADTDIGIDLYCETIEESKAFLHFFVQVKSGEQVKVKDDRARISLEKRHLGYWIRQPVPVFVFLVPEVDGHNRLYVIDVAWWNVNGGQIRANGKKKQMVEADYCFGPDLSDSTMFVRRHVPCAHVLLNASKGICMPIPETEQQYVQHNLHGIRGRFAEKALHQMRTNAVHTLWDLLDMSLRNTSDLNSCKVIQPLVKLIEVFTEYDRHWETFYVAGLYYEKTGATKKAKQKYLRAKEIIENDPNVDQSQGCWKVHFGSVCDAIKRCEASDGELDCSC